MRPRLSNSQKRSGNQIVVNTGFRKMEGFDVVAKGTNLLAKTTGKPLGAFGTQIGRNGVKSAKSEPSKTVQLEQTIQDLETQLMELRSQEQLRQAQNNTIQLEDGVPINPHILALKSQYKSIKSSAEQQIDIINELLLQEARKQQEIETSIARYEAKLKDQDTEADTRSEFGAKMNETLRVSLFEEREFKAQKEKVLQEMQATLKALTDENVAISRRLEKEKITLPQKRESDANLVFNLKAQIASGLQTVKGLERELEELTGRIKVNPETKLLEQKTLDFEAKLVLAEKDISSCRLRQQELQQVLKISAQKREIELEQKRELVRQIDDLRVKINEGSKVNDIVIADMLAAKERAEVAEAKRRLQDLSKEKEYVSDAVKEEEHKTEVMYNQKLAMQQQEIDDVDALERLRKTEVELRERLAKCRKECEIADVRRTQIEEKTPALQTAISAMETKLPEHEAAIKECHAKLETIAQQRELAKQIKSLNLQDLKISKEANSEANESLNRFIRNYQSIVDLHQKAK